MNNPDVTFVIGCKQDIIEEASGPFSSDLVAAGRYRATLRVHETVWRCPIGGGMVNIEHKWVGPEAYLTVKEALQNLCIDLVNDPNAQEMWWFRGRIEEMLEKELKRLDQPVRRSEKMKDNLNDRYHLLWPERWNNHDDALYQEHRSFFTEEELIRVAIEQELPYYDGIVIRGTIVDLNRDLINQLTAEKRAREQEEQVADRERRELNEYRRLKAKYEGGKE